MPDDKKPKSNFPKGFLWGASVSAHQVEGGNHNQWTVWELAHAAQLAKKAQKRLGWLSNWEEIKVQAQDPKNYVSGRGVEHYKRYQEDFDIVKKLNLNAFRFGIEWSRIEPEEGKWDEQAIEHYRAYIEELKKRDIEPVLNIWHWTVPVWFEKKGGFKRSANLKFFDRLVQKIANEYGHLLKYVITLNEPNIYTTYSYITGEWPPQGKNVFVAIKIYWNLARAHKRAYKILKKSNPALQIGVAGQLANIQAKRPHNFFDELATKIMRYIWNWWFLYRVKKYQDFVGVNYYYTDYYRGFARLDKTKTLNDQELRESQVPFLFQRDDPKLPVNDLSWYMEPEGLYPLLLRTWAHFKKPIIVTENGVADAQDQYRQWWIEESIIAIERAISEGVQVTGYFHWSLLDNFEWATGWWPKFGLVEVDREHGMKRQIRDSAKWFAETIKRLS